MKILLWIWGMKISLLNSGIMCKVIFIYFWQFWKNGIFYVVNAIIFLKIPDYPKVLILKFYYINGVWRPFSIEVSIVLGWPWKKLAFKPEFKTWKSPKTLVRFFLKILVWTSYVIRYSTYMVSIKVLDLYPTFASGLLWAQISLTKVTNKLRKKFLNPKNVP